jgi:hypothetical protein
MRAHAHIHHSDNKDTANVATQQVSLPGGSKCELVQQDGRASAVCSPLFAPSLPPQPECNKLLMPRHTREFTCVATNVGGQRTCLHTQTYR